MVTELPPGSVIKFYIYKLQPMQTKTTMDGNHIRGLIILNLYKFRIAPSK